MHESWRIYDGKKPADDAPPPKFPDPPPWRQFEGQPPAEERPRPPLTAQAKRQFGRAEVFQADDKVIDMVNAAIYLRRPLLVTGRPGIGKSSLAYSIALNLQLGPVLRWSITSRSTLKDGLYSYDAIGRLQSVNANEGAQIGDFIQLGPLGTALLPTTRPRVLLIDEIDKSDIDLPNDLLHVFEEGAFEILELVRFHRQRLRQQETAEEGVEVRQQETVEEGVEVRQQETVEEGVEVRPADAAEISDTVPIYQGQVECAAFPIVVLTSNGERELPPAFLRRCLQLEIQPPERPRLEAIITAHLQGFDQTQQTDVIDYFLNHRDKRLLATDQLLNAIFLLKQGFRLESPEIDEESLLDDILKSLIGT